MKIKNFAKNLIKITNIFVLCATFFLLQGCSWFGNGRDGNTDIVAADANLRAPKGNLKLSKEKQDQLLQRQKEKSGEISDINYNNFDNRNSQIHTQNFSETSQVYQRYQSNEPVSLKKFDKTKRYPHLNVKELNEAMDNVKKSQVVSRPIKVSQDSNLKEVIAHNKKQKLNNKKPNAVSSNSKVVNKKDSLNSTPVSKAATTVKSAAPVATSTISSKVTPAPAAVSMAKTAVKPAAPVATSTISSKVTPAPAVVSTTTTAVKPAAPVATTSSSKVTPAPAVVSTTTTAVKPAAPVATSTSSSKVTPAPAVVSQAATNVNSEPGANVKTLVLPPVTVKVPSQPNNVAPSPMAASSSGAADVASKKSDMSSMTQEDFDKILKEKFNDVESGGYIDKLIKQKSDEDAASTKNLKNEDSDNKNTSVTTTNSSDPGSSDSSVVAVSKLISTGGDNKISKINALLVDCYYSIKNKIKLAIKGD